MEDFSTIFRIILENSDLAKTLKKPKFLQCFVRVELLRINKKSRTNTKKFNANLELEKNAQKSQRNLSWDGLGLHFGRVRDGLGPLLDALGRLLAVQNQVFFSALALDGLQDAF